MTKFFLQITGWLLAHTPEFLLHIFSWMLGPAILLIPERRHLVYSNLHHAFPERPREWHRRIAFKSSRRLIETSILSLASPYLSDARIRRIARYSPEITAGLERRANESPPPPSVIGTLHLAYWESMAWLGLFTKHRFEVGVVFRPLKNKKLNDWIKATRERHGMKLFSRRDGLFEIFRILRRNGIISILFDQHAGDNGALTTLLGRVCSTTEFPGLLVGKYQARLTVVYPRRLGFWRIAYEFSDIATDGTTTGATIALNQWLETALAADDNLCASWLWSHSRWKGQTYCAVRFRFFTKNDFLDADLAARGYTRATMPRKTRIWVRFPETNDPQQLVAAQQIFRALRQARPDMELTLIASARDLSALQPLVAETIADRLIELPQSESASRKLFRELRASYPDTIVNLCESKRADIEAKIANSPQRFGLVRPGQRRPRLTHHYEVPPDVLATNPSPAVLWRKLFERFGLPEEKAEGLKS